MGRLRCGVHDDHRSDERHPRPRRADDDAYWVTLGGTVLAFDITTWGWIHLLFGIALVIVGALLMRGSTFARILGVVLVGFNLIAQFSWTTLYPFWAIIAIIIDILIIYALVVHGRELKD